MPIITIKNVGPIKDVTLRLNKVNVFMGPQSSGKSTIAKIISFCSWIEKERLTTLGSYTFGANEFVFRLELYYNMKGYLQGNSEIAYKSDAFGLSYIAAEDKLSMTGIEGLLSYELSKIFYIPAERHVALLPEIMKVDFPDNNLRSYVFDWLTSRKYYLRREKINILGLTAEYYYDEERKEDMLVMNNGKELLLSNASSGLQSVTPLIVLINYFLEWIYGHEEEMSFEKKQRLKRMEDYFYKELTTLPDSKHQIKTVTKTQYTRLILEEPEQNLFPSTQRDLLYYLLKTMRLDTHNHQLILTTHSPYILYALNNCMMAFLVKDTIPEEEIASLPCFSSMISPSEVSVWEIEDGCLRTVQDGDGIISDNYFDQKLTELTNEYYTMLNYYEDDDKQN